MTTPETLECGHTESPHSDITRGYGQDADGKRYCYACCAERDRADMIASGKATLYLVPRKEVNRFEVRNWPGSLVFLAGPIRKGRHNIARNQYTTYFTGPDGATWIARQDGDNTEVAHCRRLLN